MDYELNFLQALGCTIFIELLTFIVLVKVMPFFQQPSIGRLLFTGILPSFATLPYLWFIVPLFVQTQLSYIVFSESFAVIVESLIIVGLLRCKYAHALMISFICNTMSYGGWFIIQSF